MELTQTQVKNLINIPKRITVQGSPCNTYEITPIFPYKNRIDLISDDSEFTFIWDINQSNKNKLRISLHYQENDNKIGLLRIDFSGGHKNPETINEKVPPELHPYVGKEFRSNEHHMHVFVEGYKSLQWAIPLMETDFEPKDIIDNADFNNIFANIIDSFAKHINIITTISLSPGMTL